MIFDKVREHLAVDLDVDWTTDTVRAVLFDSATWTPDESDGFVGTAIGAGAIETSGTRQTLANRTAALSGGDHLVYWDGDPIIYPGVLLGEDFDSLVLYRFVTNDADSYLIAHYELGAQTGDGNSITLNPDSLGYLAW